MGDDDAEDDAEASRESHVVHKGCCWRSALFPTHSSTTTQQHHLTHQVKFPDLTDAGSQWQWGGVSLGEEETYRLQLSLKRLAMDKRTKGLWLRKLPLAYC